MSNLPFYVGEKLVFGLHFLSLKFVFETPFCTLFGVIERASMHKETRNTTL